MAQVRRPDTQQVRVTVTAGPLGLGLSLAEEGSRCVVKGFRPMPDGQPNPGQASTTPRYPPPPRHRRCPPLSRSPPPPSPLSPPPSPSGRPPSRRPFSPLLVPPRPSMPSPPALNGRGPPAFSGRGGGGRENATTAIAPPVGFVDAAVRRLRRSMSLRRWVGGCRRDGRDDRDAAYV